MIFIIPISSKKPPNSVTLADGARRILAEGISDCADTIPADNISITGVPDGMEAEVTSTAEEYNITVSGLTRNVSILRDSSVTGVLDLNRWMEDNGLEELTPGNYTIPVTFNLSEDITVDTDVNIHIRLKNADSST